MVSNLRGRLEALEALKTTTQTGLKDADIPAFNALLKYGDTLPTLDQFQLDYPDIPREVAAENLEAWQGVIDIMNA